MSKIEWTDATWNPTTGCTRASAGCDNCYAFTMTKRLAAMGQEKYQGLAGKTHFNGVLKTWENELTKPLRWKKPRMVFVNSMSDLFHKDVPFEFIDKVFCVMNATAFTLPISQRSRRWHTYQALTKRPDRMAEYIQSRQPQNFGMGEHPIFKVRGEVMRGHGSELMNAAACLSWPPPNIWLGTSVEDQAAADERIPHLLRCPAAVRFLSCEPLLGPVDLHLSATGVQHIDDFGAPNRDGYVWLDQVNWVIVGGESGPGARPCNVTWVRSIVDQCAAANVPCFVKQLGARPRAEVCGRDGLSWPPGTMLANEPCEPIKDYEALATFSLRDKKGGNWDEWPADLCVREFPAIGAHGDR